MEEIQISKENKDMLDIMKKEWNLKTYDDLIQILAKFTVKVIQDTNETNEKLEEKEIEEEKIPSWEKKVIKIIRELEEEDKFTSIDIEAKIKQYFGYDQRTIKKYEPIISGYFKNNGYKEIKDTEKSVNKKDNINKERKEDYKQIYN